MVVKSAQLVCLNKPEVCTWRAWGSTSWSDRLPISPWRCELYQENQISRRNSERADGGRLRLDLLHTRS